METLFRDLQYGVRLLLKQYRFTALAVVALGLGIGANTAMFSVINSVLLRPLPYADPDRLVTIWEYNSEKGKDRVSLPFFLDLREQREPFSQVAAFTPVDGNFTGWAEPERVKGMMVSAEYFSVLGVNALVGRTLAADEDIGGAQVMVLSHGLWTRRFGADPAMVGRSLNLDDKTYTVIGVMPPGFEYPKGAQIWTSMPDSVYRLRDARNVRFFQTIARLGPSTSSIQAQQMMSARSDQVAEEFPKTNEGWTVTVIPLAADIVGDIRSSLLILFGAVGFVLLIACTNVATLLLARGTARRKEVAVRVALGATRLRLIRQLLTESLLLAVLGGALGVAIAESSTGMLVALSPESIPRIRETAVDGYVLAFTLALSLVTGLLFGLIPALHATKTDLNSVLKEGGQRSAGFAGRRATFNILVISEIALSLVLLIGAGLLINSFVRLQKVDLGFRPENVLSMRVNLPFAKYRSREVAFYRQLLERVEALPEVRSAAVLSHLPLSGSTGGVESWPVSAPEDKLRCDLRITSPGCFRTMGTALTGGRDFTGEDISQSQRVVIVSQALAHRLWPGEDPLGKLLTVRYFTGPFTATIVGTVQDVKYRSPDSEAGPAVYVSHEQLPSTLMSILVRTPADPVQIAGAVRDQVWAIDKDQPVDEVATLEQMSARAVVKPRFYTTLLGVFAGLALVLAAVGIYGVMAYSVEQRTHEIGIRMALGAQQRHVFELVARQGLGLTAIGLAIGLVASLILTRFLSTFLFQIGTTDGVTFAAVSLVLAIVAVTASYLPARRATRVDPIVALRGE